MTRTEEINRLGTNPKPEMIHEAEENARVLSSKQAENLWGALLKNESLLRIARTPLILSLVTLVHKNRTADLPKGRARLYRECLDILLDIWDSKDKGLTSPDAPSPNDKLLALKTIAFHYVKAGLLEVETAELEKLVEHLLPSLTKPVSARSLIRQIHERSGVLVEQAIGKFGFAHRALHDYLAASFIAEENLDALLTEHAAEERWREVILIAIGLVQPKQRAETLLDSLLRRSDESPASLALAGWSLAEDIQIREELRTAVRIKIMRGLENTQTPEEFKLLSGAMFDTDPVAMQKWISKALSGHDPNLQNRVLNSLIPELGLEYAKPFIPTLTQILADPHAATILRSQCALTLAKLKPEADAELWRVLQDARYPMHDISLKSAATWATCELGRYTQLGLVKVPAGEFLMGSNDEGGDETPQHTVFLPTYYIARYPVTVDEYKTFIGESSYGTKNLNLILELTGNHPVRWLLWNEALAFAQWKGLTLPSEAEWEKAARGTDGRMYPWGNEWREGVANTREYWGGARGWWERLRRLKTEANTIPVGYFSPKGDSPYGCADMSGNVWEWTRSILQAYPYDIKDGREDLNATGRRCLRGGSFFDDQRSARCAYRDDAGLDSFYNLGFRVCASPNLS